MNIDSFERWVALALLVLSPIATYFGTRWNEKRKRVISIEDERALMARERADEREAFAKEQSDKLAALYEEISLLRDDLRQVRAEYEIMRRIIAGGLDVPVEDITIARIQKLVSRRVSALKEVTSLIRTAPHLLWMKRREGPSDFIMVMVSDHFAQLYLGVAGSFYIGKRDSEIWAPAIAAAFAENDEAAYQTGQKQRVRERVASPKTGAAGYFVGWKWAIEMDGKWYTCGSGHHEPDRISMTPENVPPEVLITPKT